MEKNDETVISLSVPPTVFHLVALLKSKSKYDDLKKKSDVCDCVKKRCIKRIKEGYKRKNMRRTGALFEVTYSIAHQLLVVPDLA